jgi:hypothetical protein
MATLHSSSCWSLRDKQWISSGSLRMISSRRPADYLWIRTALLLLWGILPAQNRTCWGLILRHPNMLGYRAVSWRGSSLSRQAVHMRLPHRFEEAARVLNRGAFAKAFAAFSGVCVGRRCVAKVRRAGGSAVLDGAIPSTGRRGGVSWRATESRQLAGKLAVDRMGRANVPRARRAGGVRQAATRRGLRRAASGGCRVSRIGSSLIRSDQAAPAW